MRRRAKRFTKDMSRMSDDERAFVSYDCLGTSPAAVPELVYGASSKDAVLRDMWVRIPPAAYAPDRRPGVGTSIAPRRSQSLRDRADHRHLPGYAALLGPAQRRAAAQGDLSRLRPCAT